MEECWFIYPSEVLKPYVRHYWTFTSDVSHTITQRIIPAGYMQMIFHRGSRIFSDKDKDFQPRSFLGGNTVSYNDLRFNNQVDVIAVVFHSSAARIFFPFPMDMFFDENISLDDFGFAPLRLLKRQVENTATHQLAVNIIENYLIKQLISFRQENYKRISFSIQKINAGVNTNIKTLAQSTCFGEKQFQRVFSEFTGMKPKQFIRVVRFQKVLHLLQHCPQQNLTDIAYECGYFDQSHMIRDFKAFSGYTPLRYLSLFSPYSDYFTAV